MKADRDKMLNIQNNEEENSMNEEIRQRTKWFMDDRFGMFIHWAYILFRHAVNG